jgi:Flp pilus assembly protein TadG
MTTRTKSWCRLLRRDGGAFSPMVAVVAAGLFTAVGLAVDGGGQMRTLEHADNLAAEAARAGGQAINLPKAIQGSADVVDPTAAKAAAEAYLAQAHATGHVTVSNDRRELTVTVTIEYQPAMLDIIGLGPWPETGSATAELLNR